MAGYIWASLTEDFRSLRLVLSLCCPNPPWVGSWRCWQSPDDSEGLWWTRESLVSRRPSHRVPTAAAFWWPLAPARIETSPCSDSPTRETTLQYSMFAVNSTQRTNTMLFCAWAVVVFFISQKVVSLKLNDSQLYLSSSSSSSFSESESEFLYSVLLWNNHLLIRYCHKQSGSTAYSHGVGATVSVIFIRQLFIRLGPRPRAQACG